MLNHAARVYLPAFQDQLRTSVLGRAMGRKTRNLQQPADEDEAKPSLATHEQIRNFFEARHTGDDAAQTDALNKIVRTWRADNAAGGVPVHAHLALPKDFASTLAEIAAVDAVSQPSFNRVVKSLDEGVQTLVAQQLVAALKEHSGASYDGQLDGEVGGTTGAADDRIGRRIYYDEPSHSQPRNKDVQGLLAHLNLEGVSGPPRSGASGLRSYGHLFSSELDRKVLGALSEGHHDRDGPASASVEPDVRGTSADRAEYRNAMQGAADWHRQREMPDSETQRGREQPLVLPVALGLFLRDRGRKALRGAAYSVAADFVVTIAANLRKSPKDRTWMPSVGSLFNSAATGAVSGAFDFGQENWKEEAGLAFIGSLAEDCIDGRDPPRWVGAIGAAVGAGLYTRYGRERLLSLFGTSRWGEIGARMTHRIVSKVVKEVFGTVDLQLLPEEVKEFAEGFARAVVAAEEVAAYWDRKIDEWSRMIDPYLPKGPLRT